MFRNTNTAAKVVIAVLLGLLILQSYMYHNKPPQVLEVEAKVCSQDGIICQLSPTLSDLSSDGTHVYMCMEGTE